jgi:Na+-driven multidrug efflux pump
MENSKTLISYKAAVKEILNIGIPSVITMFLTLFIEFINSGFVGRFGNEDILAGVGMANMHMSVTCLSLLRGMNMTLNTLVSQAYGFKDYR